MQIVQNSASRIKNLFTSMHSPVQCLTPAFSQTNTEYATVFPHLYATVDTLEDMGTGCLDKLKLAF